MGYKTILVHCDAGRTTAGRVAVALSVAERFDAHLVGFHVRQRFEALFRFRLQFDRDHGVDYPDEGFGAI